MWVRMRLIVMCISMYVWVNSDFQRKVYYQEAVLKISMMSSHVIFFK